MLLIEFALGVIVGVCVPRLWQRFRYRRWLRSPEGRALFVREKQLERRHNAIVIENALLELRERDVREPGRYV